MFPQIFKEDPVFRTREEGWKTFRMGLTYDEDPPARHVFEGQLFPVKDFDDFTKHWVPRWPGHESIILGGYEQLVRQIGDCIIVGHSQGAGFAIETARRFPDSVQAVVAVEPGGMPQDMPTVQMPPHLLVWGDHIEAAGTHWTTYRSQADAYLAAAKDLMRARVLDLPKAGICGNSHFPMMDINSDVVFEQVDAWLKSIER